MAKPKNYRMLSADFETNIEGYVKSWSVSKILTEREIKQQRYPFKVQDFPANVKWKIDDKNVFQIYGIGYPTPQENLKDFFYIFDKCFPKSTKEQIMYFHNFAGFDGKFCFDYLQETPYYFIQNADMDEQYAPEIFKAHMQKIYDDDPITGTDDEIYETLKKQYSFKIFDDEYSTIINKNKFYEMKIFGKLKIWDSNLFMKMKLSDYGKMLGKIHSKDGKELNKRWLKLDGSEIYKETGFFKNIAELEQEKQGQHLEYLLRDTFVLVQFMDYMVNKILNNENVVGLDAKNSFELKMTAGAIAINSLYKFIVFDKKKELIKNGELVEKSYLQKNGGTRTKIYYKINDELLETTHKKLEKEILNSYFPIDEIDKVYPQIEKLNSRWKGRTFYDIMREIGYRGGYTAVNWKYQGIPLKNVVGQDINSSYPAQMKNKKNLFGIGSPLFKKPKGNFVTWYYIKFLNPVSRLQGAPMLPQKAGVFNATNYFEKIPSGYNILLVDKEWELAKQTYKINENDVEINEFCYFEAIDGYSLFGKFVDTFFNLKVEAAKAKNDALKEAVKIFLNSGYGKFGSKWFTADAKYFDTELGEIKFTENLKKYYLPIGAQITAFARIALLKPVLKIFDKYVVGGDTDSWKFTGIKNEKEFKKLFKVENDDVKLGAWSFDKGLKFENCAKIIYVKTKTYMIDFYENGVLKTKVTTAGFEWPDGKRPSWNQLIKGFKSPNLQKIRLDYGIVLQERLKELKPIWLNPTKLGQINWKGSPNKLKQIQPILDEFDKERNGNEA